MLCAHLLHRRTGEPLLIGSLGVARDLLQAGVARDGRDLVPGASRLGQTPRCGLSEPVGTAMG